MHMYKDCPLWLLSVCALVLAGCGGAPVPQVEDTGDSTPPSMEEQAARTLEAELRNMLDLLREERYEAFFRQYVDPATVARLQLISTADFFVEFAASPLAAEMRASIERALEQEPIFSENCTAAAFRGGDGLPNLKLRKLDDGWRIID